MVKEAIDNLFNLARLASDIIGADGDSTGDKEYKVRKLTTKDIPINISVKVCPIGANWIATIPIAGNTSAVIIAHRHGELL